MSTKNRTRSTPQAASPSQAPTSAPASGSPSTPAPRQSTAKDLLDRVRGRSSAPMAMAPTPSAPPVASFPNNNGGFNNNNASTSSNDVKISEMSEENTRGRRMGDISFKTARTLIDSDLMSYEEVCASIDKGEGETLSKAARELEKKRLRDEKGEPLTRGGRPISPDVKAALTRLGYSFERLSQMDEKSKNAILVKARKVASSFKIIAEAGAQNNGTNG